MYQVTLVTLNNLTITTLISTSPCYIVFSSHCGGFTDFCTNQQANGETPAAVLSPLLSSSLPGVKELPFKFPDEGSFSAAWSIKLSCLHMCCGLAYMFFFLIGSIQPCLRAGFVNISDQDHDTSNHSGRMRGGRGTHTQKRE